MPKFTKLTAAAMLAASALCAQAEVIDFNGLAGTNMPGSESHSDIGTIFYPGMASHVAGYTFESALGQVYGGSGWASMYSVGLVGRAADNGTDYLSARSSLGISRTGGGSFNLNGLDLDNFYDDNFPDYQYHLPAQTTFIIAAKLATGGTVSTTVTLDNIANAVSNGTPAAFNHFQLTGFTNITSFEISREDKGLPAGWGGEAGIALDNLDITSTSPVPEPSSWAMMGLGLLGLAAYAKRRKA